MSSHKLSFGLIFEKAVIVLLFLVYRLLLLGYVLVVSHNNSVNPSFIRSGLKLSAKIQKNPTYTRICGIFL